MLDLRLLETFREVATRGSFSAAAEALSFTQPAVSQHVARLEKQLGTKLLEREPRGISLTEAGAAMLGHAESLLDSARRAEDAVRAHGGVNVPTVRLAAFPSAAAGLVPLAFRELRAAHPALRLKLRILEPGAALDELCASRIDVGLMIDTDLDPVATPKGIELVPVHEDPMLVALPAGHPLARRAAVDLEDLREEEWLLPLDGGTCPDSSVILRACDRAGFEPQVHFQSEDYQALQGLTASGMGVALIPSLAALSLRTDIVLRPLTGDPPTRRILAAVRTGPEVAEVAAAVEALKLAGRRLALGTGGLAAVA
jgi:DNA-binding transcriptional LysR family regulator